jgi:uncharacterized protein YqgC (DUF456 family)
MELIFSIFLLSIGFIFALTGIAGSVLPVIPGPPLSFLSLLIISFEKDWRAFNTFSNDTLFLIIMGVIALGLVVIDYIIPALGAKKFGASKLGLAGSIIGMIVGIFFSPLGIFIGAFIGAVAGELISGKRSETAIKIGMGTFLGNIAGTAMKLSYSIFVLIIYIISII